MYVRCTWSYVYGQVVKMRRFDEGEVDRCCRVAPKVATQSAHAKILQLVFQSLCSTM